MTTPTTIQTLTREQIADLRALAQNPRHPMVASRIAVFRDLGLITAGPPRPPRDTRSRTEPPRREFPLTELGREVAAQHPDVPPARSAGKVGWK